MKKRRISDIVEEAANAKTKTDKINVLKKYDSPVLRGYLGMTLDKNLIWELPVGAPPYKPNTNPDLEFMMYNELRRMYIFHQGKHPNLTQGKREMLFINLLESIDSKDAQFLIEVVINKKLPKGLTPKIIQEAFYW